MKRREIQSGTEYLKKKKEHTKENPWPAFKTQAAVNGRYSNRRAVGSEQESSHTLLWTTLRLTNESPLLAALQLESNGTGWKAGRKGNNGYRPMKLFIGVWRKAQRLFYSAVYFIQWERSSVFLLEAGAVWNGNKLWEMFSKKNFHLISYRTALTKIGINVAYLKNGRLFPPGWAHARKYVCPLWCLSNLCHLMHWLSFKNFCK